MSTRDKVGWAMIAYLYLLGVVMVVAASIYCTWLFVFAAPFPLWLGWMAYGDFRADQKAKG